MSIGAPTNPHLGELTEFSGLFTKREKEKGHEVAREVEEYLGEAGKAEVRDVSSMDKIKVHCIHLYIYKNRT